MTVFDFIELYSYVLSIEAQKYISKALKASALSNICQALAPDIYEYSLCSLLNEKWKWNNFIPKINLPRLSFIRLSGRVFIESF